MSKKELEKLKSDFEALRHILSHTLRDPLRYVMIKCDDKNIKDSQLRSETKEIVSQVIAEIDALKEYAFLEINSKEFKKINCGEVVSDIIKQLDKKIKISCGKLPVICGDDELIRRLFKELIDNAIKFKGNTEVEISVSAEKKNNMWVFQISDNGMGLDDIFKIIVYKPFQKINPETNILSKGMGLAFCHKIVELHGGKLWFKSKGEGLGGTTFYFSIPV